MSQKTPSAANRACLDYRAEASRLGPPVVPIIDIHTHINGADAARVYAEVSQLYGVARTFSQTQLSGAGAVRDVLGDRIDFIAIPSYMDEDAERMFKEGFIENLHEWHERFGARMVKLWGAPRLRDVLEDRGVSVHDQLLFDSPWRMRVVEVARSLGMMLMVHVADPDTWFTGKYTDVERYGSKRFQYESLERLLDAFDLPCLAAHMGGWPEDLDFLAGLLERRPSLVLDTSATKWMVRELAHHPREALLGFLRRFEGRILFGSDIVTSDQHLAPTGSEAARFGGDLAASPDEAFDLYAGRYWAQRVMWETDFDGESNIADPDLAMIDPERHDALSAPRLRGISLPAEMLRVLYQGAARETVVRWYEEH